MLFRSISVTSSVLQFNYAGKCVNILDTPGHQDFSEDTYRTLMAADSAVMVLSLIHILLSQKMPMRSDSMARFALLASYRWSWLPPPCTR